MKRRPVLRSGLAAVLLGLWIAACGALPATAVRGTLKDECTGKVAFAPNTSVSLAPTEDGVNFAVARVGDEWQGKAAAARPNAAGEFTFSGIPAGKYGVFILQAQVADATGNPLIIEVGEGASQDFGVIQITPDGRGGCQTLYFAP
jgi:hypothetical protein